LQNRNSPQQEDARDVGN